MAKEIKLWAIGGPTLGAGRTTVTAALGTLAASKGYEVMLVDVELMGKNKLEYEQQIQVSEHTFDRDWLLHKLYKECADSFRRGTENIFDRLIATPENSLYNDMEPKNVGKIILLDLGSGINDDVIDLWLAADTRLMVARPGKSSFGGIFQFVFTALLHELQQAFSNEPQILRLLCNARDRIGDKESLLNQLQNQIYKEKPQIEQQFRNIVAQYKVNLIINGVNWIEAEKFAEELLNGSREFITGGARFLGSLPFDVHSMRLSSAAKPFIIDNKDDPKLLTVARVIAEKIKNRTRSYDDHERWTVQRPNSHVKAIKKHREFPKVSQVNNTIPQSTELEKEFIKRIPL